ncbi:hypothetical protein [Azohydromonas aeria]|uniref:hypothetical protein n=1 Tax=Azohydromonas aeria TaxID=2590212 RepID=UPI0012F7DF4E|nr:hypothetical protein [Azohydromonas aeria]
MNAFLLNPASTRDLTTDALESPGRPRVLPAAWWATTTPDERALFGARHGIYSFPTVELVSWLQEFIAGRTAIEVGAGHGALAAALGIPATDNCHQQADALSAAYYRAHGQVPVTYGEHIEQLDANSAVAKHRPQVVVACWVTHRYDAARHAAGGNMYGPDEAKIIRACEHYVLIGNAKVHAAKPIWRLKHRILTPPWLYSRALNGTADFIAIFDGGRMLSDRAHAVTHG